MFIKNLFLVLVAALSFFITFVTSIQLVQFLSTFRNISVVNVTDTSEGSEEKISEAVWATVIDIVLLCVFVIQHSSFSSLSNTLLAAVNLQVLERSVYNLTTSCAIQFLIHYWRFIPTYTIWVLNTDDSYYITLIFTLAQFTGWIIIYGGCIVMSVTEILGIKQVYYYVTGRPDPVLLKSPALKHLHTSMAHPSLIGFLMVFWIYPCMSLDRFILAVIWSVYMFLAWQPDDNDYNYVLEQRLKKQSSL